MKVFAVVLALLLAAVAVSADVPKGKTAGLSTAPIIIEVYSDFQCPGCKALYEQTLRPLMRDFVAAGKVYLVHHEFPLPGHAYAREAAAYASAAARIGRYEEVANALFANQASWSTTGKVDETVTKLLSPADAKKVRALVKEPAIEAEIQQDVQAGNAAGIRQTPTLFVNYRMRRYPFSGAVNYDLLRTLLND